MSKDFLTDLEVEEEIARLRNNEFVALSKKEQRLRYKRRQYMYQLRTHEKHGKELAAQGYTLENIEAALAEDEADAE